MTYTHTTIMTSTKAAFLPVSTGRGTYCSFIAFNLNKDRLVLIQLWPPPPPQLPSPPLP